jgi:hypothetical protein
MQPTSLTLSTCSFELTGPCDHLPRAAFLRRRRPRSSAMKRADGLLYASEEQARFAGSLDVLELSSRLSPSYEHECRHGA